MQDTQQELEEYVVTARKWRPQLFTDVIGQEHVTQTLRNAVLSGRMHHAYIFNGPRGVGKTSTARILAKALNCSQRTGNGEPCGVCSSCEEITRGRSLDVVEIDGASNNSVDDVRKLRDNAKYPPVTGAYKMYIIDEVHMLSTSAFNALLKTLEEPPKHLIFVFATTEPHKIPATILSRCQRFDFRRMQIESIVSRLRYIAQREGILADEDSLVVVAKKGDGSMRDSQSIFDQVVSFCGKNIEYAKVNEALNLIDQEFYFTLARAIRHRNAAQVLDIARLVFTRGYDLQECLGGLQEHYRNILTILAVGNAELLETSRYFIEQYTQEAAHYSQADVLNILQLLIEAENALRFAAQPRLRFEFVLMQLTQLPTAIDLAMLLSDISEARKSGSLPAVAGRTISQPVVAPSATTTSVATLSETSTPYKPTVAVQPEAPKTIATTATNLQPASEPISTPPAQPNVSTTSTASVEQNFDRWLHALKQQTDFAAVVRILRGETVHISFRQNEIIIDTRGNNAVGGILEDLRRNLEQHASDFFRCAVTIVLKGSKVAEATQLFAGFTTPKQPVAPATLPEKPTHSLQETEKTSVTVVTSSATVQQPATVNEVYSPSLEATPDERADNISETEEHELDAAIISLFNAESHPVRRQS